MLFSYMKSIYIILYYIVNILVKRTKRTQVWNIISIDVNSTLIQLKCLKLIVWNFAKIELDFLQLNDLRNKGTNQFKRDSHACAHN